MISKKSFRDFDFGILGITLLLLAIGLLTVYSTTYLESYQIFVRQIIWIVIGIFMATFFYLIPLRFWKGFSAVFYLISVIALVLVLMGKGSHGVRRWFDLGIMRFQPSEIAKLGSIFLLASFLSNKNFQIIRLRNLTIPLLIITIPFLLVLIEPDAGTSLIFLFSGISMLFYKGTPLVYLFIIISPAIALICGAHWISLLIFLIVIGVIFYFARLPLNDFIPAFLLNLVVGILHPILWGQLKPYQQARIIGFLFSSRDPHGAGWQMLQSKIAIGSGGLFGKGILQGTQTGFNFLPEVHTDFVFSAIGEELGFMGCLILLVCFFALLWKGTKIVVTSRVDFNSFLGIGILSILGIQMFMNIGMTTGIMPVIGAPLPFISYGGSSMFVSLIMIGLLLNIAKHRYEY